MTTNLEDVRTWIDGLPGLRRTGPVTLHRERPWGRVWVVRTDAGRVWCKEPAAATGFEVPLYEVLARHVPERVLVPLAVGDGRVLLPDGGPGLRERCSGPDLVAAMEPVLGVYGQLQRDLAAHVPEILAAGVEDLRPSALPGRFARLLDELAPPSGCVTAGPGDPAAADRAAADRVVLGRLARLRADVGRWSAELAAAPGGVSLDHDDLHAGNVLAGPRFYDWGDAVVAHPFTSAVTVVTALRAEGADRAALDRCRDAYLEPFGDLAPHAELVRAFELACRVGLVARSAVWLRAAGPAGFDGAALQTLAGLLDP